MSHSSGSLLGMCFNRKLLGAIAVLTGVALLLAPGTIATLVPLLLLAACPLSMLLMGKMMVQGHQEPPTSKAGGSTPETEEIARLKQELREARQHAEAR